MGAPRAMLTSSGRLLGKLLNASGVSVSSFAKKTMEKLAESAYSEAQAFRAKPKAFIASHVQKMQPVAQATQDVGNQSNRFSKRR